MGISNTQINTKIPFFRNAILVFCLGISNAFNRCLRYLCGQGIPISIPNSNPNNKGVQMYSIKTLKILISKY